mmetsp:Transcript_33040/g.59764  ORF Transcript_33040/g.59764 Transcript_33040/m.59764 type:complete len:362 (-) Transcript_33040:63-1148(-)|eukprot:CAMPEP_0175087206 /NCGR_PEP_ID=MMETSP0052_2-20121109/29700_1 /TAXON_ID=51329 ORGANISM="Polytomella parva, Strain SAG 63-3" /NCGR_SAMPLE_ID=MMETSP0052_2 /ASSEMBLY_ACC=CAM_ASM_000194 /LENGTH=361 /DNA_ID=CAMNT_0016359523 /DNA_START=340 /DNA_END=1425 /DNA_ORIENTATION=-
MGERKVLNKYFPPDFDPAKLPKGQRKDSNEMKVRMMLPMSVRCKTCGNYMYKGTKFNTRKEDVHGENYLGIQILRFYYRCKKCSAEFCMKTDPKNQDYVVEAGASRNFEPWREEERQKVLSAQEREEEERGNAMKALENRTLESKREMDILAALDELRSLKGQQSKLSTEDVLAALNREAELIQEEEAAEARSKAEEDDAQFDLSELYELRKSKEQQQKRRSLGSNDCRDSSKRAKSIVDDSSSSSFGSSSDEDPYSEEAKEVAGQPDNSKGTNFISEQRDNKMNKNTVENNKSSSGVLTMGLQLLKKSIVSKPVTIVSALGKESAAEKKEEIVTNTDKTEGSGSDGGDGLGGHLGAYDSD